MSSVEEVSEIVIAAIKAEEDFFGENQHFLIKFSWKQKWITIIGTNVYQRNNLFEQICMETEDIDNEVFCRELIKEAKKIAILYLYVAFTVVDFDETKEIFSCQSRPTFIEKVMNIEQLTYNKIFRYKFTSHNLKAEILFFLSDSGDNFIFTSGYLNFSITEELLVKILTFSDNIRFIGIINDDNRSKLQHCVKAAGKSVKEKIEIFNKTLEIVNSMESMTVDEILDKFFADEKKVEKRIEEKAEKVWKRILPNRVAKMKTVDLTVGEDDEPEVFKEESIGDSDFYLACGSDGGSVDENVGSVDANMGSVNKNVGSEVKNVGSVDKNEGSEFKYLGSVEKSDGSLDKNELESRMKFKIEVDFMKIEHFFKKIDEMNEIIESSDTELEENTDTYGFEIGLECKLNDSINKMISDFEVMEMNLIENDEKYTKKHEELLKDEELAREMEIDEIFSVITASDHKQSTSNFANQSKKQKNSKIPLTVKRSHSIEISSPVPTTPQLGRGLDEKIGFQVEIGSSSSKKPRLLDAEDYEKLKNKRSTHIPQFKQQKLSFSTTLPISYPSPQNYKIPKKDSGTTDLKPSESVYPKSPYSRKPINDRTSQSRSQLLMDLALNKINTNLSTITKTPESPRRDTKPSSAHSTPKSIASFIDGKTETATNKDIEILVIDDDDENNNGNSKPKKKLYNVTPRNSKVFGIFKSKNERSTRSKPDFKASHH